MQTQISIIIIILFLSLLLTEVRMRPKTTVKNSKSFKIQAFADIRNHQGLERYSASGVYIKVK